VKHKNKYETAGFGQAAFFFSGAVFGGAAQLASQNRDRKKKALWAGRLLALAL